MLGSLITQRPLTGIQSIGDRNNVVMLLDSILPTDNPVVQAYADFQAAMLDIYDRDNGLAFGADVLQSQAVA